MSNSPSTLDSSGPVEDMNASRIPDDGSLPSIPSANDAVHEGLLPRGTPPPTRSNPVIPVQDGDQPVVTAEHDISRFKAPALTTNSPIDLRMLDYVNPCDENLICPICRCPFVDPVILVDCDHCFCRDCIRQTWASVPHNSYSPNSNRKDCPSCRTPAKLGLRSSTNKILTNILDDMVVRCPHTDDGCTAQIKRAEVQDHVSLYCGYTMVECTAVSCQFLIRRKDVLKSCLHVDICCIACHAEMQFADLESHWKSNCHGRDLTCGFCHAKVNYRDLTIHQDRVCPRIAVPCPGKSLGCTHESERVQNELHSKSCPLATLAPIFAAQKRRLDEQEMAQKQMNRRMKILENGFSTMRDILYPPMTTEGFSGTSDTPPQPRFGLPRERVSNSSFNVQPAPADAPADYLRDFDLDSGPDSSFSYSTSEGLYTSPVHHLLSMHENLREEMSRISNALQELDGRQSLQILNENLRTREEMSYLGAQLASLTRQMHWLTSTQLQQQTRVGTPGARNASDIAAAAGTGVEAAVSAMNTAVRGAARMVGASREGMGNRRGSSEEGRTKL